MPEIKRAGARSAPMTKAEEARRTQRRAAAVEMAGREENTAEIMAEVLTKSKWLQDQRVKDLLTGKRVAATDYEEFLKKAYNADKPGRRVWRLKKKN